MKYPDRPAEDGWILVPPSGGAGDRMKASDREVTTGKNFKHPLALRDSGDLQLNIDLLDSEGK